VTQVLIDFPLTIVSNTLTRLQAGGMIASDACPFLYSASTCANTDSYADSRRAEDIERTSTGSIELICHRSADDSSWFALFNVQTSRRACRSCWCCEQSVVGILLFEWGFRKSLSGASLMVRLEGIQLYLSSFILKNGMRGKALSEILS